MRYTVHKVSVDNEFKICPTCDYRDGFHWMLKKSDAAWKVLFICPSCHDVFDVGVELPFNTSV